MRLDNDGNLTVTVNNYISTLIKCLVTFPYCLTHINWTAVSSAELPSLVENLLLFPSVSSLSLHGIMQAETKHSSIQNGVSQAALLPLSSPPLSSVTLQGYAHYVGKGLLCLCPLILSRVLPREKSKAEVFFQSSF